MAQWIQDANPKAGVVELVWKAERLDKAKCSKDKPTPTQNVPEMK